MKKVTVVGIGMGNVETITLQGIRAIEEAKVVIGAKRMVDSLRDVWLKEDVEVFYSIKPKEIAKIIEACKVEDKILVLMSGDTGFFSGTKKLVQNFKEKNIQYNIIAGISSISYLSSKLGESWGDWKIVSLHGRDVNPLSYVSEYETVFLLLDAKMTPAKVCELLTEAGFGETQIVVGERLSYEDEKIRKGLARDFTDENFDSLSVMVVKNLDKPVRKISLGIRDEEYIRGKVPMTKEEIRTVSISKLDIEEEDIIYDVGAGTGSVAIEMALLAKYGKVFAIETKKEAVELIERNKEKFGAFNLEIVEGLAPEALEKLPAPNKVFIGGSKGNMREIVETILLKNPQVKFVINAIALETLNEVMNIFKELDFEMRDIIQLAVTRTKKIASYTMLDAINPIFIAVGKKL